MIQTRMSVQVFLIWAGTLHQHPQWRELAYGVKDKEKSLSKLAITTSYDPSLYKIW
jgi:hypothetical protein